MTLPSRDPIRPTPTRQSARDLDAAAQLRARTPVSNPERSDLLRSDPQQGQVQGMPIMPVTDTQNRASWENSRGGRQQTSSANPPSSGRTAAILLAVGGAAALLALGAFFWSTRLSEPAQAVTPVLSTAAELAPGPARAAIVAVPTAVAPSPTSLSAEAIEKADGASGASTETAKAATEIARPAEGPTSAQEIRTRRAAPPWAPAPPAPNPAAPGKGLTDFGGRR
jgi:hypothetical protein